MNVSDFVVVVFLVVIGGFCCPGGDLRFAVVKLEVDAQISLANYIGDAKMKSTRMQKKMG